MSWEGINPLMKSVDRKKRQKLQPEMEYLTLRMWMKRQKEEKIQG